MDFNKIKALIIDNTSTMERIIRTNLNRIGCIDTISAETCKEALEILNKTEVDFIIIRYKMPNMKTNDLVKSVRSSEKTKDIPILMVTTTLNPSQKKEKIEAGIDSFIVKPFTPEALKDEMTSIFAS